MRPSSLVWCATFVSVSALSFLSPGQASSASMLADSGLEALVRLRPVPPLPTTRLFAFPEPGVATSSTVETRLANYLAGRDRSASSVAHSTTGSTSSETPENRETAQPLVAFGDAPSFPRLEFGAGYSFLRDLDTDVSAPLGWNASITRNVNRFVGLVGDVGGNYRSEFGFNEKTHTFLGGVRLSVLRASVRPYAEVLVGVARSRVTAGGQFVEVQRALGIEAFPQKSIDGAYQVGGGADLEIVPGVAIRAGLDWRSISAESVNSSQIRLVVGIIVSPAPASIAVPERSQPRQTASPPRPPDRVPPTPAPITVGPRRPVTPSPPTSAPPERPAPPPTAPPPARPAPPTTPPVTSAPRATTPAPMPSPTNLEQGRTLLSAGHYTEAAEAFLQHVRQTSLSKYTIAVGLFCNERNLAAKVSMSHNAPELFLLPASVGSRQCVSVLWGEYSSEAEAREAIASVPANIRSTDQRIMMLSLLAR